MEKLPDRRVFLRGAAGAVGMGAVGVFAARARFADASERDAASVVVIPVKYENGQADIPDAEAERGNAVIWEAQDGVHRIIWVKFDEKPSYPFHPAEASEHHNPEPRKHLAREVRDDPGLVDKSFKYSIKIKPIGSGAVTIDPDLDIVG
jgi:hypothetical protein